MRPSRILNSTASPGASRPARADGASGPPERRACCRYSPPLRPPERAPPLRGKGKLWPAHAVHRSVRFAHLTDFALAPQEAGVGGFAPKP